MAFIQSHDSLIGHPKLWALMEAMAWDEDTAIAKLHRFWWWALKYAPTGDLHGHNDGVLARSVGLAVGAGGGFVKAMVVSGWIDRGDGRFCIHDWADYAGRYLRDYLFKRKPDKWAEVLALYPQSEVAADVEASATSRRQVGVKDLNGPKPIRRSATTPSEDRAAERKAKILADLAKEGTK